MPSDRVEAQFIVVAEIPDDEEVLDAILAALTTALDDTVPEATNTYADVLGLEPIT